MPVQEITTGAEVPAGRRGSCVICITVERAAEDLIGCVGAVVAHSPADAPILVCDYTRSESTVLEALHGLGTSRKLFHLRSPGCGDALDLVSPADVVLLRPDCTVALGWLEGLRDAAYADSRVATATAIAEREVTGLEPAAAAVRAAALRLRPCIAAAGEECVYVRRTAIELIGASRPSSLTDLVSDGDFSARCVQNGLAHVLADDVLVSAACPGGVTRPQRGGPVGRALGRARRARSGLSVIVDAGILSAPITGTQVNVLETIAALGRTEAIELRVLVPAGLNADAARRLESAPGVQLLTHAEARNLGIDRADVVHRPFQISNPGELPLLSALADRLVITHQDLIGYFNPAYSASREAWEQYRQLTRGVLAVADRVMFVSGHARDEALAEELVEPGRATVAHLGVDHRGPSGDDRPAPPAGVAQLRDDAQMMLCIGADYHHKNRPFALRVLAQMRSRHGWDGCLVFAGPHVPHGSSAAAEAEIARSDPGLAASVLDCGIVTENEKAWLYQRAGLVVYPTVHEGFGLVPFEAAEHAIPCMWAAGTSLSEVLPDEAAAIVAWDAELTAQRAIELLRDGEGARRNIDAVTAAGTTLTWDATAASLLEAYGATCDAPAAPASPSERRHGRIGTALSEDSMRLIGPGGALPSDVERPLLAVATHPRIAAPLFGALKLGYRMGFRLRRLGSDGSDGDDAQRRK